MKYGVFSDVHGNYEALVAVLEYFRSKKVDAYVCCGDLVGYGPQPDECVQLVASLNPLYCVIGNHDMAVVELLPIEWFNANAGSAIEFSRERLSIKSVEFLRRCPAMLAHEDMTVVHGSPKNPPEEYLLTGDQYLENYDKWDTDICFVGHSHIPLYFTSEGVRFPEITTPGANEVVSLSKNRRHIINPGSVGQPRDKNPRAACGIYDTDKKTFEFIRLKYPVDITQKLMRDNNLPEMLVERIGKGW